MSLGLEIEKRARENPDDTFIIFADQKFTYKDFNQLCNRYADIFNRQGLKKGEVVILLMNNCPEYLAIVAGLSKLGVVPALVNTGVRGETLAHDINLVDARAVIVQSGLLDAFQNVSERIRLRLPALIFAAVWPILRKYRLLWSHLMPC
jgi:acyl-CoA synthetase (AMP-forming)/AMP-acid ligase II